MRRAEIEGLDIRKRGLSFRVTKKVADEYITVRGTRAPLRSSRSQRNILLGICKMQYRAVPARDQFPQEKNNFRALVL